MTNQEKTKMENKFLMSINKLFDQDKFQVGRVFGNYTEEEAIILLKEIEKLLERIDKHKQKFIESIPELVGAKKLIDEEAKEIINDLSFLFRRGFKEIYDLILESDKKNQTSMGKKFKELNKLLEDLRKIN